MSSSKEKQENRKIFKKGDRVLWVEKGRTIFGVVLRDSGPRRTLVKPDSGIEQYVDTSSLQPETTH